MAYSIFGFVCYKEASVQGVIKLQTWRFSVQFKINQNKEVPSIFYSEEYTQPKGGYPKGRYQGNFIVTRPKSFRS